MKTTWEKIHFLSNGPSRDSEWLESTPGARRLVEAILEDSGNVARGSGTDDRILIAWCYSRIGQYEAALAELTRVDLSGPSLAACHFYSASHLLTRINGRLGRYETALEIGERVLARCRGGIVKEALPALIALGSVYLRLSRYTEAEHCLELVASVARLQGDERLVGRALHNLSLTYKNCGRLADAANRIEKALKIGTDRDLYEKAVWLQTSGHIQLWQGRFDTAKIRYKETLSIASRQGLSYRLLTTHLSLGHLNTLLEDPKAARKHLEQGLEMALQLKFPREEALAYEFLGDLARVEGRGDEAGALYEKGMQIGLRIAPRGDVVVEVGRRLAEWHTERGETNEARRRLEHALEIAESTGDRREEGILHRVSARLIVASGGRQAAAEQSFKKSLAILEDVGARFEVALTHAARARVRAEAPRRTREERRRALDDFQAAASIFRELGLSKRQGLLLVEAAQSLAGVLSPYEGLSLLREAEELLRPHRAEGVLGDIATLRASFEEQTARVALEREGPFFLGEGDASSLEPAVRLLARRLGARRAFLHLPHAPEGPRVVGCDAIEAEETLARLHFPAERTLLVSAGDLSGEGSACFGPFLAFRYGEEEASILYLERRIGADPFREKEAGEFAASAERLLRKIPYAGREPQRGAYPTIIAGSRAMQDVVDRIVSVRNSSATVLIEGETGTGKGLLARLLHELGDRARAGRFIHLHCAELPETLLESELFGHVRGSFTGAVADKEGLFEIARGGTLFLDEVGDLTPAVQTRLLRVIEEGRMKRVGEAADREIDVRIIAATHRNLEKEIVRGRFRPDLFYRLQVVRIAVPPLRDRAGDIPLLADHFLTRYAREEGKEFAGIDSSALRLLARYPWPGNVRELQNEVRRILAVLPSGERIGERHLSPAIASGNALRTIAAESPLQSEIADFEEFRIREVLAESEGNAAAAARTLGLSPQLLRYKIRKYGISFAGQTE